MYKFYGCDYQQFYEHIAKNKSNSIPHSEFMRIYGFYYREVNTYPDQLADIDMIGKIK